MLVLQLGAGFIDQMIRIILANYAENDSVNGIFSTFIDQIGQIMPTNPLDDIDLKILERLQSDGRITNQQLSEEIGLSPSPCLRRVRLLEDNATIARYVALVRPEAVGLDVTAFVRIRLDQQDDAHLGQFETSISAFPEVMECYLMTGEADYQLRVLVRSLGEFEDFLRYKLTKIKGVSKVTTSFALRPVVYHTALPLRIHR